jgi:hypothetical protein
MATRRIGTPSQSLDIFGDAKLIGSIYDINNSAGSSGQILSTTGSGVEWVTQSGAEIDITACLFT